MAFIYQKRRTVIVFLVLIILALVITLNTPKPVETIPVSQPKNSQVITSPAIDSLKNLVIKGYESSSDYSRDKFGSGWRSVGGCDTRNIILNRDLMNAIVDDSCNVISGVLNDPYTGKIINFIRGKDSSSDVQIDHVVALSDAWQTGASYFSFDRRVELANDPLELLAVDGKANMEKSGSDAANWLPLNKAFRCQYIARQIAVKQKYSLWVTQSEQDAMSGVLQNCPGQMLPSP